jgi:hypothetical protein
MNGAERLIHHSRIEVDFANNLVIEAGMCVEICGEIWPEAQTYDVSSFCPIFLVSGPPDK